MRIAWRPSRIVRFGMAFLGCAMFILFLPTFIELRAEIGKAAARANWPTVPGIITRSEVSRASPYFLVIGYEYKVGEARLTSSRLGWAERTYSNRSAAEQALREYPLGKAVEVRYSPDDPSDACLQTGDASVFYIAPVSCLLVGAALFILFYLTRKQRQPAAAMAQVQRPLEADDAAVNEPARSDEQAVARPYVVTPGQEPPIWHYAVGGQQGGPVTLSQLRRVLHQSPRLGALVWRPGMVQWAPPELTAELIHAGDPRQAATDRANRDPRTKNARENCIVMFVIFCLAMLVLVLAGLGGAESAGCYGLFVVAGEVYAALYLPLRWRVIRELSPTVRTLGLIGGFGLIGVLALTILGWVMMATGNAGVHP